MPSTPRVESGGNLGAEVLLEIGLTVTFYQEALGSVAQEHGQEDDEEDLFENGHEIDADGRAHECLHIERGGQGTEDQADNGHFHGSGHVAFGKTRPGDGHAAGGNQSGQDQTQSHIRPVAEKGGPDNECQEGDDGKVDDLGDELGLHVAALENLADFQRDHHGIDHEEGERHDQVFEPGGVGHDTVGKARQHHHRDGEDQVG